MLLNSKNQLIVDHMNAIANYFGGWKEENLTQEDILTKWDVLVQTETKARQDACVLCDGSPRGKGYYTNNPNANCEIAENRLIHTENTTKNVLKMWFKDPNEDIRRKFFVNRDPRGYALKLELATNEGHQFGIYTDWGGYGILCPKIELKSWEDDNDQMISRYMFN